MRLKDITSRTIPPLSWAEGENIPWNDPDFSRRMLAEHLSQEHNLASRRFEIIDRQVGWIHGELLSGRPTRLLELACGPGLYTSRLATGAWCVGIDYAPERSLRPDTTAPRSLDCRYRLEDCETRITAALRMVMRIFGQFCLPEKRRVPDPREGLSRALARMHLAA